MSAWDYDCIVNAQNAWHKARRDMPPLPPAEEGKKPPPITPGAGPQMVDD